jgi:predicted RNA binding protein YcfA (HicA-like mRNA interferase family)
MHRIPRDVSGQDLVKLLKSLGYQVTRQTGSHIRLTLQHQNKSHHITVPNHAYVKIGEGMLKLVEIR